MPLLRVPSRRLLAADRHDAFAVANGGQHLGRRADFRSSASMTLRSCGAMVSVWLRGFLCGAEAQTVAQQLDSGVQ